MHQFDLNNRTAIITGGAQGFGLAITERFIEAGAKVVIWDIDEDAAKKATDKNRNPIMLIKIFSSFLFFLLISKNSLMLLFRETKNAEQP